MADLVIDIKASIEPPTECSRIKRRGLPRRARPFPLLSTMASSAVRRSPSLPDPEKAGSATSYEKGAANATGDGGVTQLGQVDFKHDLHRGLQARHITMIAIGGALCFYIGYCRH
jgi:hypothetical protein